MNGLTIQDIDILLESLDAWEAKIASDYLMKTMLTAVAAPDKESREKEMKKQEEEFKTKEMEWKTNKEIVIMLKAKLLLMKGNIPSAATEEKTQ